ncbi:MAG: universal stress protein UspA [Flavobacteriaceae bacterium]|nr:universal stress protein UspA [Flavobacteriaceae bacterium]
MKKSRFKNILIGFAFSPNLKANVFEAIRLAASLEGSLYFLHVGDRTSFKEKTFNEILNESPISPKKIHTLWELGNPVEVIIKQCVKNNINLLLLGALQRENMVKFYLGSIARKITRNSPCSVLLLIKPSIDYIAAQHMVVNAFKSPYTENTITAAFEFAKALEILKITLVEEISRSKVAETAEDDKGLRLVTQRKKEIQQEEHSRVKEIIGRIPDNFKINKTITSQSIFGARGYSIGHYAKIVRADLLVINAENKRSSFWARVFPKDLEHILSELPTNVLIIQPENK